MLSDQKILVAIKTGNGRDAAFVALYKQCGPIAKKMAFDFKFSTEDAKDILQDAIMVFWQKVNDPDFLLSVKISTYISAVCKHKFLNKKRGAKGSVPIDVVFDLDMQDPDDSVDEVVYTYREEKLVKYLDEIGGRCRDLVMGLYSGLNMTELALKFGYTSQANATNQRYKCMNRLREKFGQLKK